METDTEEQIYDMEQQENPFKRTTDFLFSTRKKRAILFSILLLLFALYLSLIRSPSQFPVEHIIKIEKGATLKSIAENLKSESVIRSPFFFRGTVIVLGGEKSAHAGEYYLENKEGVFTIAYRIAHGKFELTPIRVQVQEGLNTEEVALHLTNSIDTFDMTKFLSLAKEDEGYLFPDTYYFLPNVSEEEVYRTMKETFDIRLEEISEEVESFIEKTGIPTEDIVTMASIIELEASDPETKRDISGVLWNRMEIGMALQVDASFAYLLNKGTSQLSLEDLEMDSPYNTYKYRGLPPGPIANPGLDSILAAVTPTKSDYFYYLADKDGMTHFSKTFAEHSRKKALYID
ncbi:endolytic transglycosylase MltG [candidate division KSB1 bacterium]